MQIPTYAKARKYMTLPKQGREHRITSQTLAGQTQGESYGWWSAKTTDPWGSIKWVVGKGMDGSLCLQRQSSLNLSHLPVPVPGLYTAAQPQERVCVSPPEVPSGLNHSVILWYTFLLQSSAVCVGKLLHAFQSFLLAVGFPLLCFWMALKNHKNFLSCSVSSLWPQNETN